MAIPDECVDKRSNVRENPSEVSTRSDTRNHVKTPPVLSFPGVKVDIDIPYRPANGVRWG